jgi:DNA recombination protein RmuC
MDIPMLFAVVLLSIGLGILLGRSIWPFASSALFAAQTEIACLTQECTTLRHRAEALARTTEENARLIERISSLTELLNGRGRDFQIPGSQRTTGIADADQLATELAKLLARESALTAKTDEQRIQLTTYASRCLSLEAQLDAANSEAKGLAIQVAGFKEREAGLVVKVQEQAAKLSDVQKGLITEFENIANRILKTARSDLSEDSRGLVAAVLDPLRERIHEFQSKVETTFDAEKREVLSLKEQVRHMVEMSHAIGHQAEGLAKALRGDTQLLGSWGELALERILESAGLTEGREYVSQGRALKLKDDNGAAQRPDIIIKLPEDRVIIADSKAPLAGYERLIAAKEEKEQDRCRIRFLRDMKAHIDELAGKCYQDNAKLRAHEYVLMFVPIEGALATALQADPGLFIYGWDRRVVLVGPSTLLMTLRTVGSIWRYEAQGRNAREIARLAAELCDKVTLSLNDMQIVADKMSGALVSHNEAVKRLSTGKGNVLTIGDRIRSLGVVTRRPPTAVLVDGVRIAGEPNLSD